MERYTDLGKGVDTAKSEPFPFPFPPRRHLWSLLTECSLAPHYEEAATDLKPKNIKLAKVRQRPALALQPTH